MENWKTKKVICNICKSKFNDTSKYKHFSDNHKGLQIDVTDINNQDIRGFFILKGNINEVFIKEGNVEINKSSNNKCSLEDNDVIIDVSELL